MLIIPDICLFFSTHTIFGTIFLHTKARKLRQKILDKTALIATKLILESFNATKRHKLYTSFLHITELFHISHVESFFPMIICHMKNFHITMWRNFSTWQIFSPQTCWWRWRQISGMQHMTVNWRKKCWLK